MRPFNPVPQALWEAAAPLPRRSGHPCPQPALLLCHCKVWLLGRRDPAAPLGSPITQGLQFSPSPHPWSLPKLHCRHPCAWPRTLDPDPDLVTQLPSLTWDLPWHRGLASWSGLFGGPRQRLQTCPAPPAPLPTSPGCSCIGEASALLALLSHSCCSVEPGAYDTKQN